MSMTISASAILLAFVAFLVDKAVGGVASEYSKRTWFKYIEPWLERLVRKLFGAASDRHEDTALASELAMLDREVEYLETLAGRLIAERDALLLENIRLRVEQNARVRATG